MAGSSWRKSPWAPGQRWRCWRTVGTAECGPSGQPAQKTCRSMGLDRCARGEEDVVTVRTQMHSCYTCPPDGGGFSAAPPTAPTGPQGKETAVAPAEEGGAAPANRLCWVPVSHPVTCMKAISPTWSPPDTRGALTPLLQVCSHLTFSNCHFCFFNVYSFSRHLPSNKRTF